MLEGSVMSIGKMWLGLFIILSMFALGTFFINVNKVNDYRQYVNIQIEKNGGLTSAALEKINDRNEKFYSGQFTILSDDIGIQKPFGELIEYKIRGKYNIFFLNLPVTVIDTHGKSISRVRI